MALPLNPCWKLTQGKPTNVQMIAVRDFVDRGTYQSDPDTPTQAELEEPLPLWFTLFDTCTATRSEDL
jgi:hypothetical protein